MILLDGSSWKDLASVLAAADTALNAVPGWQRFHNAVATVAHCWALDALPPNWDQPVDECGLALMGIDAETTPVPALALVLRCPRPMRESHPLTAWGACTDTLPYEWAGRSGLIVPLLSEQFALCLAGYGNDWYAATQEPLMARLLGRLEPGEAVDADVAVRIDWRPIGGFAETLLRRAAEFDLIPRRGLNDVEYEFVPLARLVSQLGTLEVLGRADKGGIAFEGYLVMPLEENNT
jgi:hypothetical protein